MVSPGQTIECRSGSAIAAYAGPRGFESHPCSSHICRRKESMSGLTKVLVKDAESRLALLATRLIVSCAVGRGVWKVSLLDEYQSWDGQGSTLAKATDAVVKKLRAKPPDYLGSWLRAYQGEL
jgi:hypothetical protein